MEMELRHLELRVDQQDVIKHAVMFHHTACHHLIW